jgi:hypothetical protein
MRECNKLYVYKIIRHDSPAALILMSNMHAGIRRANNLALPMLAGESVRSSRVRISRRTCGEIL